MEVVEPRRLLHGVLPTRVVQVIDRVAACADPPLAELVDCLELDLVTRRASQHETSDQHSRTHSGIQLLAYFSGRERAAACADASEVEHSFAGLDAHSAT